MFDLRYHFAFLATITIPKCWTPSAKHGSLPPAQTMAEHTLISCSCSFSCGPLESSYEYGLNNTDTSPYDYCTGYDQNLISEPKCVQCLSESGNRQYLANCKHLYLGISSSNRAF